VLAIDQGGNGGDGWAVDFLTVGVTTTPVPVPGALLLAASGLAGLFGRRRHRG
jgi:MprA protease rhombosortase-interaction domain-containing protein